MSYGPPPKTRYGDEDFIKEDWDPQTSSTNTYNPPSTTRDINLGQQNFGGNLASPPQSAYGGQQPVNYTGRPQEIAQLAPQLKALTQEDILFMRSWKQDAFFYRIFPITAISSGAYYYYNMSKKLPQKISRYCIISGLCYLIGNISYRNELKRRVEASQSTTPYMQALRQIMNIQSIGASGFVSETFSHSDPSHYNQPISGNYEPMTSNFDATNLTPSNNYGETPSTTSYEELRARNRGSIPR